MVGDSSQYFDEHPSVASAEREIELLLPDLATTLVTDRGVFSAERIDPGTKYLLLEAPKPPSDGALLDLGCGYGTIAAALAHRSPDADIWAIDVNGRARDLCARNVPAATVAAPDDVPTELRFDAIYSNPPIRIGKAALHELLRRWLGRLAPDGVAYLVVQKHLGADSLAKWLRGEGWHVTRLGSRMAFRLLAVRRAEHA